MKPLTVRYLGVFHLVSRGSEEGHACTSPCWKIRDGALVSAVRCSKKDASYSSLTSIHHGSVEQEAFQCVYIWWWFHFLFFVTKYSWFMSFPGGTSGKEPACQCRRHKRHGFYPGVGKSPWGRAWQPTPAFLPGKSHGQRSLAGYSLYSDIESNTTEAT